ncbi:MAG TPA: DUF4129 domain-containing protein [Caulobacteraceae bacterium]|jgi:hypothetical protein
MAFADEVASRRFPGDAAFPEAHRRLLTDRDLQFTVAREEVRPPAPRPEWADWISDVFGWIAPALTLIFWAALAFACLGILYLVGREFIHLRLPQRKPKADAKADWRPAETAARALLQEADALAAEGRFAEATHLLLLRSIEDIQGRRPRAVQPALTARDIAGLDALPPAARPPFSLIAEVVERSLFGGRPVDADGFGRCRRAYEDFALPHGWTA